MSQELHPVSEEVVGVDFNYDEYPTLLRLVNSRAKFRAIIGPSGSAKTSGLIAYLLLLAMQQTPFRGVRSTRMVIARQSYQDLAKSTVQSLKNVLGAVGEFTDSKPPRGHIHIADLGDGTALDCQLVFIAMDGDNVAGSLKGLEGSVCLLDEVSEMPDEDLVNMLVSRMGRYPSQMQGGCTCKGVALAATNGPLVGHWLHRYALGEQDARFATIARETGRPYFELFRQPPALLRPDNPNDPWKPNPRAENVKNVPGGYGYWFEQLALDDQKVQALVEGEFAELRQGKLVFPGFGAIHRIDRELFGRTWQRGKILISFDFGRTPVALIAVERGDGGLVVIDEVCAEDVSIDTFYDNHLAPVLKDKYGQCRIEAVTGDPSGMDLGGTTETSPFQILQGKGLPIEPPAGQRLDRLPPRIEATRNRIARLGSTGLPMLMVTSNCKRLLEALTRTYVYSAVRGHGDTVAETPTKSHAGWRSDLADALQYLCLSRSQELESADADPYGASERRPQRPMFAG